MPRCLGLRKVLPADFFRNVVTRHYSKDGPKPDVTDEFLVLPQSDVILPDAVETKRVRALQSKVRWWKEKAISPRKRPRKRYSELKRSAKYDRIQTLVTDNAENSLQDTVDKLLASLKLVTPDKDLVWLLKQVQIHSASVLRTLIVKNRARLVIKH